MESLDLAELSGTYRMFLGPQKALFKCLAVEPILLIQSSPQGLKPAESWYGLGWFVRPVGPEVQPTKRVSTWHTGSLPGTATILIRRHDGLNVAVLFNSRISPTAAHLTRDLEGPLHAALDAVREWPAGEAMRP